MAAMVPPHGAVSPGIYWQLWALSLGAVSLSGTCPVLTGPPHTPGNIHACSRGCAFIVSVCPLLCNCYPKPVPELHCTHLLWRRAPPPSI